MERTAKHTLEAGLGNSDDRCDEVTSDFVIAHPDHE